LYPPSSSLSGWDTSSSFSSLESAPTRRPPSLVASDVTLPSVMSDTTIEPLESDSGQEPQFVGAPMLDTTSDTYESSLHSMTQPYICRPPSTTDSDATMLETTADTLESSFRSMTQPYVCRPPSTSDSDMTIVRSSDSSSVRPKTPLVEFAPVLQPGLHRTSTMLSDADRPVTPLLEFMPLPPIIRPPVPPVIDNWSSSSGITDYLSSSSDVEHGNPIPLSSSSGITDYLSSADSSVITSGTSGCPSSSTMTPGSPNSSVISVIPRKIPPPHRSPLERLRDRNARLDLLEQNPLEGNSHALDSPSDEESEVDVKLFQDPSLAPSFIPEGADTQIQPWAQDGAQPSDFLGQELFTGEWMAPRLSPQNVKTVPTPTPRYNFSQPRTNISISSSDSDDSTDPPQRPPKPSPSAPSTPVVIQPSKIKQPGKGHFAFFAKALQKEIAKQRQKPDQSSSSSSSN